MTGFRFALNDLSFQAVNLHHRVIYLSFVTQYISIIWYCLAELLLPHQKQYLPHRRIQSSSRRGISTSGNWRQHPLLLSTKHKLLSIDYPRHLRIWHCLAGNNVIPVGCLKNISSFFVSASSKALLPYDIAACIQFRNAEAARLKVTADIPISWVSVSSHDILTIGSPMNWKRYITTTAELSSLALKSIYKPRRLYNPTIFIQTFWSVCAALVSWNNFHAFL